MTQKAAGHIDTQVCHAGLCTDEKTGAVSTPIYQTATFRHRGPGLSTGYDYSRTSNPTRGVLNRPWPVSNADMRASRSRRAWLRLPRSPLC